MENTIIDGRYHLVAAIGSGGEARVFRATDSTSGADVAVRLMVQPAVQPASPELPPISHDGWVLLLATGNDSQHGPYQVLELLQGNTLSQYIQTGPFDEPSWRYFVDHSLDAVEAVHLAGWTHGDLNADNFVMTDDGWKLLELPFYRFDPGMKRSPLFGSIHTLSPEQFNGHQPDPLSDIYALGCLYYYAGASMWPNPGATATEVAISCLRFPPQPLTEQASHLPAAWCDWVMRLLSTHPLDRPASVAAARQLLGVAVA